MESSAVVFDKHLMRFKANMIRIYPQTNNNIDLITIYIYYYQVYAFTISRLSADAVRGGDPVNKSLLPLLPIFCCWVANPAAGTVWAPVFLGGGGRVGGLLGRAGGIFFSVTVAGAEAIGAPIGASNKLSGVLRPVIKKVDNLKVLGYFVKLRTFKFDVAKNSFNSLVRKRMQDLKEHLLKAELRNSRSLV